MVQDKKIKEKSEKTKTTYENGAKIIETTTTCYYDDGSTDETTNRRTIY
jgi:hypothetical protein